MLLAIESRSSNIAMATNNDGNRGPGRGEGTASDIDEERSVVFFIILTFQMTGASPRRCRRRPPSAAGQQDLVWGCSQADSAPTTLRQSRQKNVRCVKRFAASQPAFEP